MFDSRLCSQESTVDVVVRLMYVVCSKETVVVAVKVVVVVVIRVVVVVVVVG